MHFFARSSVPPPASRLPLLGTSSDNEFHFFLLRHDSVLHNGFLCRTCRKYDSWMLNHK